MFMENRSFSDFFLQLDYTFSWFPNVLFLRPKTPFLVILLRALPGELGQSLLRFYGDCLLRHRTEYYRTPKAAFYEGPIIVLARQVFQVFLFCGADFRRYVCVHRALKELN